MVDFLKKYSLPWVANRIAKKNSVKHFTTPYLQSRKILIVFTSNGNQKIALLKVLQSKMEKENKEVSFLYLLLRDEDRPDVHMDEGMVKLDKREVSLFGQLQNDDAGKLLDQAFDYIIHADLEWNIYTDLIIAKSKARCRIGRHFDEHDSFYDIMIKIRDGETLKYLIDQLYHYTQAI